MVEGKSNTGTGMAILNLTNDPVMYVGPIVKFYETGIIVPPEEIPKLINAFQIARKGINSEIDLVVSILKKQLEASKKK